MARQRSAAPAPILPTPWLSLTNNGQHLLVVALTAEGTQWMADNLAWENGGAGHDGTVAQVALGFSGIIGAALHAAGVPFSFVEAHPNARATPRPRSAFGR